MHRAFTKTLNFIAVVFLLVGQLVFFYSATLMVGAVLFHGDLASPDRFTVLVTALVVTIEGFLFAVALHFFVREFCGGIDHAERQPNR